MIVREATIADAAGIGHVHVASWRTSYRGIVPEAVLAGLSEVDRTAMWTRGLSNPENEQSIFVAEDERGRIVGFAAGGPSRTSDSDPDYAGELYAVYLLEQAQRLGLGQRLVRAVARRLAERELRSLIVWVFKENSARRFYESLGGRYLREQQFELGGAQLVEVAYGWSDTSNMLTGGTDADPSDGAR